MRKESLDFMTEYFNAYSPTGFEENGQKIWMTYLKDHADEIQMDKFNNATAILIGGNRCKRIVIEAHADEIAWFVHYIDEKGFIYVKALGGSDIMIAHSKRVDILTDNGIRRGIFGIPAIHVRDEKDDEKGLKIQDLFIDVGCISKEEVEALGIRVGNPILFDDKMEILNDKYIVSKAIDDKLGGFITAEVIRAMTLQREKTKLPFDLIAVNSAQEEIGLRGAQLVAHRLRPDLAICIDVTHETNSPKMDKLKQGDISFEGIVLTVSPQTNQKINKFIESVAKKNNIKIQYSVNGESTGTDTDSFAYSRSGIPAVLLSIPLRYMHTTVEMAKISVVEDTIRLLTHCLESGIEQFLE